MAHETRVILGLEDATLLNLFAHHAFFNLLLGAWLVPFLGILFLVTLVVFSIQSGNDLLSGVFGALVINVFIKLLTGACR